MPWAGCVALGDSAPSSSVLSSAGWGHAVPPAGLVSRVLGSYECEWFPPQPLLTWEVAGGWQWTLGFLCGPCCPRCATLCARLWDVGSTWNGLPH